MIGMALRFARASPPRTPEMQRHRLLSFISAILLLFAATACDFGLPAPAPTLSPTSTATPPPEQTATVVSSAATPTQQAPLSSPSPTAGKSVESIDACPEGRLAASPRDGLSDDLFPLLGNGGYDAQHY